MIANAPLLSNITLAILAGGEGSRMGMPKGQMKIAGTPILEYLFDSLRWPGPAFLVTAPGREHPPGWENFSAEIVDPVSGLGPLRGILTALEHSKTEITIALPVDMPAMKSENLAWLAEQMASSEDQIGALVSRSRADQVNILEPFPCAFRQSASTMIQRRLQARRRAVHSLSEERGIATFTTPIDWPDSIWLNLNFPADAKAFESTIGKIGP